MLYEEEGDEPYSPPVLPPASLPPRDPFTGIGETIREAAGEFLKTYRLWPTAAMLYNLARAYDGGGEWRVAVGFYREYVDRYPNSGDVATIKARIEALETRLEVGHTAPPVAVAKPAPIPAP